MIILDTNVVSETTRLKPDPVARAWLNAQVAESLYLTSITVAELGFGVAALPAGKRRDRLQDAVDGLMPLFAGRVLGFDAKAAIHFARLAAMARKKGRALPLADGYIAAIASANGFSVATRDTSPFEAVGLNVINPWGDQQNLGLGRPSQDYTLS